MRRTAYIGIAVLFLMAAAHSFAQSVQYESFTDWRTGKITTEAKVDISALDAPLPTVRRQASVLANSRLDAHLLEYIKDIPVASGALIGDLILRDSVLLSAVHDFTRSYTVASSHVSPDLKVLTVRYVHYVYPDLASLFVTHARVAQHDPALGFSPSTRFTGIIIYAKGELPVHGELGKLATITQALRPKIFDESMRLLYDPSMAEPDIVHATGAVSYDSRMQIFDHIDRTGSFPVVTMARALFGEHTTDLVIPTEIADRILALPENRELLREAKIVIICDL